MVSNTSRKHLTTVGGDERQLTKNCGRGKTTWLEEYRAVKGYEGLRESIVDDSHGCHQRGESFRFGRQRRCGIPNWCQMGRCCKSTRRCPIMLFAMQMRQNQARSRIGSFLRTIPHRIIEGLLIAAYAIGASRGYIYIRGEYTEPYEIMQKALAEAVDAGLMHKLSNGQHQDFEIEIRRGAGAYICGEETALFESIEG